MSHHARVHCPAVLSASGLVQVCLLVLASPAILCGVLVATLVMVSAALLALVGVLPRQPRAPWRRAAEAAGAWLSRQGPRRACRAG